MNNNAELYAESFEIANGGEKTEIGAQMQMIDFILSVGTENLQNTKSETTRFVPIKLKPEEAKRAKHCQMAMLDYTRRQYLKSIGTNKEEIMRQMYNDAVIDYEDFIEQHKNELNS